MSVAHQKQDLREIIYRDIAQYLKEHPEKAVDVALGAISRYSGKLTLKELEQWHMALHIEEWMGKENDAGTTDTV